MHWSVSAGVSKSLSSGKPPRRGWPSVDSLFSFWLFFSFLLSSHFSLLSPHLYSSLHLQFCLYFVPLSFDLPLTLSTCLLTLSLGPEIISHIFQPHLQLCFFPFSVFTFCPLSLNDPQCCEIWFPFSQNCKASRDQRSKVKKAQWRKREKDRVLHRRHTRPPSLHRQSARLSSWGQRNWLALSPLLSERY